MKEMKKAWIIIFIIILIMVVVAFFFTSRQKPDKQSQLYAPDLPQIGELEQPIFQHPDTLMVCSFNIQFLGHFTKRDNRALADILKHYDIVAIQKLVTPPYAGTFPNGDPFKGDTEAAAFFDAMQAHGFTYMLSEEDTGPREEIHDNRTSTEWFVTFYKPETVRLSMDLPWGFLAEDRSQHPDFERVPYAFPFRTLCGTLDFVLISVHLQPDNGTRDRARRKHELQSIAAWINQNCAVEKDFIIVGDMNIYSPEELVDVTPSGYLSLNDECRFTNTLTFDDKGKPYDHVLYNVSMTREIDIDFDLVVIDLVELMRSYWIDETPYPGDPYDHNLFKQHYSDHSPVIFRLITPAVDDDGPHI